MPMQANAQVYSGELMLQLPVRQIFEFARKNRVSNWRTLEKEIDALVDENKEELEELLSGSIMKAISEETMLGDVTEETSKDLREKFDHLNTKFKHIDDYFNTLDAYDQRNLILPFIGKESKQLTDAKDRFRTMIISKSTWDSVDTLMYTYYLTYLDAINALRNVLKKASRDTIISKLNLMKALLFLYKPILISFMLDKPIPIEVLRKKTAQLRTFVNPNGLYVTPTKIYEAEQLLSSISPIME